jgi:FtsH-binding integral membrane protein
MNNDYRDWGKLNPNANTEPIQDDFQGYQSNYGNTGSGTFSNGISGIISEASEALQQKVVAQSFIFMVAALAVTWVGAKVASAALLEWMMSSPVNMIILFVAEIAIVLISNVALKKNNVVLSACLFTAYSFINGAMLGIVCSIYTDASVAKVIVITGITFAVTALYGLVAKKDLSSVGSLCIMGLIGLILVGLINFFVKSEPLDYLASFIGVAVFVGLTAYDTQKIKKHVAYADSYNVTALSLNGAFELYLDFINLFLYLLKIFGKRR